MGRRARAAAAVLLLAVAGCQEDSSPESVGRGFFDAVCTGEFEQAYEYLDPEQREMVVGPLDQFVRDAEADLGFLGGERFCAARNVVEFSAASSDYGVLVLELEWLVSEFGVPGTTEEVNLELVRVEGDWYVDPHSGAF